MRRANVMKKFINLYSIISTQHLLLRILLTLISFTQQEEDQKFLRFDF